MPQIAFFLQFALPTAAICYLLWKFVLVRLLNAYYYKESVRAQEEAIRIRLAEQANENDLGKRLTIETLSTDQIDQAISELHQDEKKSSN